jgi:CheY-like chemotaxis protein
MTINASANHEGTASHHHVTDITQIARRAQIQYAAWVSPGLSELYRLSVVPLPGERPDVDDLVWQVSCALGRSAPKPLRPANILVEFPSFLAGERDATVIRAAVTLLGTPGGQARLCVSTPEESPQLLPLVLVAEADDTTGRCICRLLAQHEFHAMWVRTEIETLECAAEYLPDLVLLGLDFGGAGELAVCSKLRANPRTGMIPVIIPSAGGGDLVAAGEGCTPACLGQPVDDLAARVNRIVADSGLLRGGVTPA